MGSQGGAPLVVCCMCGDHGLQQELFRCKLCLVRSQHKYCSNLYPRVESYRVCNWCLRQEAGNVTVKEAAANDSNNSVHYPSSNNNINGSSSGSSIVKINRGVFSPHLNKAVKKQRLQGGSTPKKIDRSMKSEETLPRKQVFRGKVRRYKLLEEVSSPFHACSNLQT